MDGSFSLNSVESRAIEWDESPCTDGHRALGSFSVFSCPVRYSDYRIHSSLGTRQEQVLPIDHPGHKGWDPDHQSTVRATVLSEALKPCLACHGIPELLA